MQRFLSLRSTSFYECMQRCLWLRSTSVHEWMQNCLWLRMQHKIYEWIQGCLWLRSTIVWLYADVQHNCLWLYADLPATTQHKINEYMQKCHCRRSTAVERKKYLWHLIAQAIIIRAETHYHKWKNIMAPAPPPPPRDQRYLERLDKKNELKFSYRQSVGWESGGGNE